MGKAARQAPPSLRIVPSTPPAEGAPAAAVGSLSQLAALFPIDQLPRDPLEFGRAFSESCPPRGSILRRIMCRDAPLELRMGLCKSLAGPTLGRADFQNSLLHLLHHEARERSEVVCFLPAGRDALEAEIVRARAEVVKSMEVLFLWLERELVAGPWHILGRPDISSPHGAPLTRENCKGIRLGFDLPEPGMVTLASGAVLYDVIVEPVPSGAARRGSTGPALPRAAVAEKLSGRGTRPAFSFAKAAARCPRAPMTSRRPAASSSTG